MQAITKIVETREFPYLDDYFWKNNGNTTHKSGRRSVYYKCSNSGKVSRGDIQLFCVINSPIDSLLFFIRDAPSIRLSLAEKMEST